MTIALWYLWLEVLGAIGFVLAWPVCRALPDRGWCAAKTLGVLLLGLLTWWAYALGLLRNTSAGITLATFGLAAIAMLALTAGSRWPMGVPGGGGWAGRELVDWVRSHWRFVVVVEVLFALGFLGWCLVRANDPAADHTEEPMDLMLLVAVSSSDSFPPADPWLAGYPISYYYMGYWLLGALGRLVGTPPEISYNLGQATWYALLLVGVFGLAFNLAAFSVRRGGENAPASSAALDGERAGVRSGLIAALLVCFSANIALPLEWGRRVLQGTGSAWAEATSSLRSLFFRAPPAPDSPASGLWGENWWWWRSSRVVQDTQLDGSTPIEVITEFPFFSYLLGDNHPHVLAMPVVVTVLTLAFAWFARAAGVDPSPRRPPRLLESAIAGLGLAAVAGSIVAINTWDLPGVWSIVVLAVAAAGAAGSATGERWRRALLAAIGCAAVLVLGSALLYLPYHLTASSQVQGIIPNFFHPTRLGQVALMFATLVPGLLLLLLDGWRSSGARPRLALTWWLALLGASLAWLIACVVLARLGLWSELLSHTVPGGGGGLVDAVVSRWSGGWLTLALCTAVLALLLETLRARWSSMAGRTEPGVDFALLLAATGVALIVAPELVYLHDSFGTRMNTVFKLWYQAWLLIAVAGAVGLAAASRRRGGPRAAAVLGLALILPGIFYPVAALWSKTGGFGAEKPTLDSLAWLETHHPEELEALRWVRTSTATSDVLVQRSGGSYRVDQNLPSMVTGRATLLGWGGHEYQWRGSAFATYAAGREEALERMYRPPSAEDLQRTLSSWNVDYLYVGPQERSQYNITAAEDSVYAAAMDLAFENPQVRIYRRRG